MKISVIKTQIYVFSTLFSTLFLHFEEIYAHGVVLCFLRTPGQVSLRAGWSCQRERALSFPNTCTSFPRYGAILIKTQDINNYRKTQIYVFLTLFLIFNPIFSSYRRKKKSMFFAFRLVVPKGTCQCVV